MNLDLSTIPEENERKVAEFLDKIGFSFVYSRSQFNGLDWFSNTEKFVV